MARVQPKISLIEVLVISGLVIFFCAVLFLIWRTEGLSPADRASLENIGALEKGMRLYELDFDEGRVGRQSDGVQVCLSWRQLLDPYLAGHEYLNVGNPAAAFDDAFSDPRVRASICLPAAVNTGYKRHKRGFVWNNIFGPRKQNAYWDLSGLKISSIVSPATTGDIIEAKSFIPNEGPFSEWVQDVDASTGWIGVGSPVTGLKWNLSGDHYNGRGMNAAYVDGHARFVAYSSLCSPWIKEGRTSFVIDGKVRTFWGFTFDEIKALGPGSNWMQVPVQGYCATMPPQFASPRTNATKS